MLTLAALIGWVLIAIAAVVVLYARSRPPRTPDIPLVEKSMQLPAVPYRPRANGVITPARPSTPPSPPPAPRTNRCGGGK